MTTGKTPIYGIGIRPCQDRPDDPPQQLFLTFKYTRAALTALVVHEACCVYQDRRILHNTSLGFDQLQTNLESESLLEA
jgi:hypothetical protein